MLPIPEDFQDFGFVGLCKPMEQQARAAICVCRDALLTQKRAVILVTDARRRNPGWWSWVQQEPLNAMANSHAYCLDLLINIHITQPRGQLRA